MTDDDAILPRPHTAADLAVEALAASEARLLDQQADLALDLEAYRLLGLIAVHELYRLTTRLRHASETIDWQRQELRALRGESAT